MFGLGDAILVIFLAVIGLFMFLAIVGFIVQFFDWLDNRKTQKELPSIGSAEYGIAQAQSRLLAKKELDKQLKQLQEQSKQIRELKKYI